MTPIGSKRRGWRPATMIGLAVLGTSGCASQLTTNRPPAAVRPVAADILNVSAVAPGLNDEFGQRPPTPRPSPGGLVRTESRPGLADTQLQAAASVEPPVPTIEPPALQEPTPSLAPGARSDRPDVNFNAGLMGPTPAVSTPAATTPPSIPQTTPPQPIDLTAALRLADAQNPAIGEARILILGALAERQAARVLLLPNLNAGTNYHDHTGPLQRSSGTILKLTEQSLYVGGGARTLAAESVAIPAVNIFSPLTDAIFEPLAAQQRVNGARFNASDTANKILLDVASLYIDLIGAQSNLEARRATAAEADRIAESVAAYAETGQGRRSDADRAETDRRLFQRDIQRAEEEVAVASALLAERLNLDPSGQLQPVAGPLEALELINPEAPTEALIRTALAQRPDLAARGAQVAQADYRVRQEQARPLLPTVWLGFSGGAFGGGSNLIPGSSLGSFAGRTDFDVRAYWTVLNAGLGNASLIKQRKAQAGQANADRIRAINEIRGEVTAFQAQSLAARSQVANARAGLRTAEDGYRQDQTRLRESLSLPIEALDSLRLLADARLQLIRAVTRANRTQFALFVALGTPPPLETPPVGPGQPGQPTPPVSASGVATGSPAPMPGNNPG